MAKSVKQKIKYFKYHSCVRKKRYSLKNAFSMMLERRSHGDMIDSIYKCFFCNSYHIGHYRKQTKYRVKQIFKMIGEIDGS